MEKKILVFEHPKFGKVHGYLDQNGTAWFNAADVARGLGFVKTEEKLSHTGGRKTYTTIRWERINGYLQEFGFPQLVGKDDFIPENMFYRLAMKANNETAQDFQAWLADEVVPSVRKTGIYSAVDILKKILELANTHKTIKKLKCVYAFEMENGTVKIGYTQNVRQRMQTIMTSSGLDIVNAYCTEFFDSEIAYCIEQACHETFDALRVRGEFFKISFADACAELEKYNKNVSAENQKNFLQQVTL